MVISPAVSTGSQLLDVQQTYCSGAQGRPALTRLAVCTSGRQHSRGAVVATICSSAVTYLAGAAYALAQQRRREALLCWMGNLWQALSRLLPMRLHRWRRPGVRIMI